MPDDVSSSSNNPKQEPSSRPRPARRAIGVTATLAILGALIVVALNRGTGDRHGVFHSDSVGDSKSDSASEFAGKSASESASDLLGGIPDANEQTMLVESVVAERSFADQLADVLARRADSICVSELVSDDDVQPLADAVGLTDLRLDGGRITDRGLEAIARNPSLVHLRLRHSPVSDRSMPAIARMPELRILNLPQSDLSADGIDALRQAPALRSLRLASPRLQSPQAAAEAIESIARLPHLRSLHLIDVPIDDAGLMRLASIQTLASLYLDGASVSDNAWEAFFEQRPQIHVHINQVHHDLDPHAD